MQGVDLTIVVNAIMKVIIKAVELVDKVMKGVDLTVVVEVHAFTQSFPLRILPGSDARV